MIWIPKESKKEKVHIKMEFEKNLGSTAINFYLFVGK